MSLRSATVCGWQQYLEYSYLFIQVGPGAVGVGLDVEVGSAQQL
jgi:hypothetical protein